MARPKAKLRPPDCRGTAHRRGHLSLQAGPRPLARVPRRPRPHLPPPPQAPALDWYYTVTPGSESGGPSLARNKSTDKYRTHIGFDFDPKTPSWRVFGDLENRILKTLAPAATMSTTLPAATIQANALAEFDRRIHRERTLIDHWRDKISYLRRLGRLPEARAIAAQALQEFPTHYWPRMALAALWLDEFAAATVAATFPDVTHDFAVWVADNPTYTHYYYLAILQRLAHNDPAALAALQQMTKLPMQRAPEDSGALAYYAWDATRLALRQEQWDLAIALCDQWQAAAQADKTDELSYLPLRAAARLARNKPGDLDQALTDLDNLAATKLTCWASGIYSENLPALRAAIKARNPAFRFNPAPPGSTAPGEFHVFSTPQ